MERQARQHATLVRDRRGQDDIERADAVGRDHQETVVVDVEEIANLALRDELATDTSTGSFSKRSNSAAEVAQEPCRVEQGVQIEGAASWLGLDRRAERRVMVPRGRRRSLHDPVGLVARPPRVHQPEQDGLAEGDPAERVHLCAHPARGTPPARRRPRSGRGA